MKREKFVEEVEKLGFIPMVRTNIRVGNANNKIIEWIDIYKLTTGADVWVGVVGGTAQYDMSMDDFSKELTLEVKAKLFDLMVEYAKTPIKER